MSKKIRTLLALLLATLLTACGTAPGNNVSNGQPGDMETLDPAQPFTVAAAVSAVQHTLDPAADTAAGSETVLFHLYENLLRWEDDGSGFAKLAPGQAESYTVETDYAGNATFTFTLREGIQWSDGQSVTAGDFVSAWRRLADPANDLPHREMMRVVAGYDQPVPEDWEGEEPPAWDPALLAVSAPDQRTFVVTLVGSSAYFLPELAAGAYTMPVRSDLLEKNAWGDGKVTNGAFTADTKTSQLLTLTKSETYYDAVHVGPEVLEFITAKGGQTDYDKLLSGALDLAQDLPTGALQELSDSGSWVPEPVSSVYGVMLNTQHPPFDNADIRQAFLLAVDSQAVVDALQDLTLRPAAGLVPYGIADYGEHPMAEKAQEEEAVLPEANAAQTVEPPDTLWDFRAHSLEKLTLPEESDYAADCLKAQALLAQAGYAGGGGFPVVEYIYVESDEARAVAQALQTMWREQLGVTVTVRGLSQEEYDTMLLPGEGSEALIGAFDLAGQAFTAAYDDADAILYQWHSMQPTNFGGYSSDAFDILLDSAEAAVSFEARDAYLHDAEAILLTDAPVIPVFFRGGSYRLSDSLTGLYRGTDGVFFLDRITAAEADS